MTRRVLGAVLALLLLTFSSAGCNLPSGVKSDEQVKTVLFEDRPDRRDDDYDRALGSDLTIEPWKAVVTTAEFRPEIDGQTAGYIVANVTITNVGVGKREPDRFHWQVMTPSGELKNTTPVSGAGEPLPEEDLQKDEEVSATLVFTTGGETGTFYIVFNPTKSDTDLRGVWGPVVVG